MKRLDDDRAIEVAENIWWLGFADFEAGFSNNPYLVIDEGEGILFDPGPGHPFFRDLILQKIKQVLNPEKIRYIIVSHPDPDLCGLIPYIENILHPDLVILADSRSSLFIPYYGIRKNILPVGDGDSLQLRSGRKITFCYTPYVHFAGNMVSYDEKTRSLFSGDIFAAFTREWNLYADETYIELSRGFIEHYIAHKDALLYAYDKLKLFDIKRIFPQHGGIIEEQYVSRFLNVLLEAEPGQSLRDLKNKPDPGQIAILIDTGKAWLAQWLKREITAGTLDDLLDIAIRISASTVSLLMDTLSRKARAMGVANPLTYGRIHRYDNIQAVETSRLLDSIRRRFMSRQHGMDTDSHVSFEEVMKERLQSLRMEVLVMFIDIRGFTPWSANKSPDEIVDMLNRHHEVVSKIINSGGGRVNKILGDGILAYFPEDRIVQGIDVARRIHRAIREHNLMGVGIGCDFGKVIMGDIGEESRLDYTLIGEIVNYASRMCDSAMAGQTAITSRVYKRLDPQWMIDLKHQKSIKKIMIKRKPADPEIEGIRFSTEGLEIAN